MKTVFIFTVKLIIMPIILVFQVDSVFYKDNKGPDRDLALILFIIPCFISIHAIIVSIILIIYLRNDTEE